MAECNGCGDCCEVVPFAFGPEEVRWLAQQGEIDIPTATWAVEHLRPLTRRQVAECQPWRLRPLTRTADGGVELFPRYWTCDLLDPETRRCTDYANRPPPCRGYPWYNGEIRRDAALSPRCSYRADIGQPVEIGARRV